MLALRGNHAIQLSDDALLGIEALHAQILLLLSRVLEIRVKSLQVRPSKADLPVERSCRFDSAFFEKRGRGVQPHQFPPQLTKFGLLNRALSGVPLENPFQVELKCLQFEFPDLLGEQRSHCMQVFEGRINGRVFTIWLAQEIQNLFPRANAGVQHRVRPLDVSAQLDQVLRSRVDS